jgi:hypothetical protein
MAVQPADKNMQNLQAMQAAGNVIEETFKESASKVATVAKGAAATAVLIKDSYVDVILEGYKAIKQSPQEFKTAGKNLAKAMGELGEYMEKVGKQMDAKVKPLDKKVEAGFAVPVELLARAEKAIGEWMIQKGQAAVKESDQALTNLKGK